MTITRRQIPVGLAQPGPSPCAVPPPPPPPPCPVLDLRIGNAYSDAWMALIKKTTILQILKWASEYAFHLLDVPDDPEGRQVGARLAVRGGCGVGGGGGRLCSARRPAGCPSS